MPDEEVINATETKKSHKTLFLILSVAFLCVLAGAAWWFFFRPAPLKAEEPKAGAKIKATLHLEGFVVNLDDPDGNHFLRVGIDLGLGRPLEEGGRGKNDIVLTGPIRDAILEVLSTRQAAALLSPDGKAKLKEELLHALQERVPELGVSEVYFTDFLVQR